MVFKGISLAHMCGVHIYMKGKEYFQMLAPKFLRASQQKFFPQWSSQFIGVKLGSNFLFTFHAA
jgi:hypothetical protein